MTRIEKTVFISYRRTDISWALAVYQYLTSQKYDVFFDYTHIPSGDFEQIIVSNIKARAHFVLILTPNALDRTSNEGDWLRREIETAMDEKRNIVPLFFDGFSFGLPNVAEKLTGRLADVKRYNGLDIPSGYFPEAMERLSTRYLNTPLNAVIHPVSTEVRKKVKEEKVAVSRALREQMTEIKELVKSAEEKGVEQEQVGKQKATIPFSFLKQNLEGRFKGVNVRNYGIGVSVLLIAIIGLYTVWRNIPIEVATPPTSASVVAMTSTKTFEPITATSTGAMTSQPTASTSTPVIMIDGFLGGFNNVVQFYQNDDRWKNEKLGNSNETIGGWGSLLTSLANLLSGYGYDETPLALNEKLKESGGYDGAFIAPSVLPIIFPNIESAVLQQFETTPAPVAEINKSLDAGQPVILQVDWNKQAGIQVTYVLAYMRKDNDYLIMDPYKYGGDSPEDEVLLTSRYKYNGGTLEQEISAVLWIKFIGN